MKCDIFISYRRQDGRELARTLRLALANLGYENIFFDYNSLRDGMFNDQIITAINECNDFILVLTPDSMNRCVNENDWVRREITEALEVGCNIIPVVIDDKEITYPERFPRKLNIIKNIQTSKLLTNEFFEESIKRIADRLHSQKKEISDKKEQLQDDFVLTIHTDETCKLYINGESSIRIKKEKAAELSVLSPGEEYLLEFHSLAVKKDIIQQQYKCPKINKTDKITLSFNEMRARRKEFEKKEESEKQHDREIERRNRHNLRKALQNYDKKDISVHDGMILVQKGALFGFLNEKGFETVLCQYEDALHFSNGVACVKKGGRWGFINTIGLEIIPFESEVPSFYSHGLIIVSKNGKYGAIDINGTVRIPLVYDCLSQPTAMVILGMLKNEFLLMDLNGKEINPFRFDQIEIECVSMNVDEYHNRRWTETETLVSIESYHYIDKPVPLSFHDHFPHEFRKYYDFRYARNEFYNIRPVVPCIVRKNKRFGYVDKEGKIVIPLITSTLFNPYHCSAINNLSDNPNNFLIANYQNKWGAFNGRTGDVFIPFEYDYLELNHYHPEILFFTLADVVYNDHVAIPFRFFNMKYFPLTDRMGAIDIEGRFFIPMEYNYIRLYRNAKETSELVLEPIGFRHNTFIGFKLVGEYKPDDIVAFIELIELSFSDFRHDFENIHFVMDFFAEETNNGIVSTIKYLKMEHVPQQGFRKESCHEVLFVRNS